MEACRSGANGCESSLSSPADAKHDQWPVPGSAHGFVVFFSPYTHSLSLLFFFFFFSFLKSQTTKQEVTALVLLPWDPSLNELEVSTSSIP